MRSKTFHFLNRLSKVDSLVIQIVSLFAAVFGFAITTQTTPVGEAAMTWLGLFTGFYLLAYILSTVAHSLVDIWIDAVLHFAFRKERDALYEEEEQFLIRATGAVLEMPAERQEHYWKLLWEAMEYDHPIAPQDEKPTAVVGPVP